MAVTRASLKKELEDAGFVFSKGDNGEDVFAMQDGTILGGLDDHVSDETRKNIVKHVERAANVDLDA